LFGLNFNPTETEIQFALLTMSFQYPSAAYGLNRVYIKGLI